MTLDKSQIIVPSAYLGMGAGKTCCSLVADLALFGPTDWRKDQLIGGVDGGGPCTTLSPGLRSGCLESKFGPGPGHPRQESGGLVLLVPGVQAERVSSGHPAGHIDSRIARRSGMACLVFSTIVRTESGKEKNRTDCSTLA